jgi:hypothetical protein
MDFLGALLGSGLATAFVLSLLEYFSLKPLLKALVALSSSFVAIILMSGISWQVIPLALGATFLGVLLFSLVSGRAEPSKYQSRIPKL